MREKRTARETALALLFFAVVTCAFTFPLVLRMHRVIIGDVVDPYLNNWIIAHGAKSIFTSPSTFFQGNILYPARDVITYSEHFFSLSLLVAPVYFATGNPVLCYNLLILFSFIFSGLGAFLLARYLTDDYRAGLLAGTFFAFCNYKFAQVTHLNAFFSAFLPLTVLYFHRFWKEGRKKHLFLFFLFFLAQSLASWYYFVFVTVVAGLLLLAYAWRARRDFPWRKVLAVVLAMAACLLLLSPFALAYWRTHRRLPGFERTLSESEFYGIGPQDFRTTFQNSLLYGNNNPLVRAVNGGEKVVFTGLVVIFLACAGLYLLLARGENGGEEAAAFRGGCRDAEAAYLFAAAVILLFMLGPRVAGIRNYFYVAFYDVGLLRFIRVPARFFTPFSLCLAVLGGIGMRGLLLNCRQDRHGLLSPRGALAAALILMLLAELAVYGLPFKEVPLRGEMPQVYRWLQEQGDVRVIELPFGDIEPSPNYDGDLAIAPSDLWTYLYRESLCTYWSIFHGRTIANGNNYWPYSYRRIVAEMQGFPSPRTVEMLGALRIDLVIWHWDWVPEEWREDLRRRLRGTRGLEPVMDFGGEEVFAVRATDAAAGPDELEVDLAAPGLIGAGTEAGCGLLVGNASGSPYAYLDEEPHLLRARWLAGGETALEEEVRFWPPFYLAPGDCSLVPFTLRKVPPPGAYRLQVELTGWPREATLEVSVRVEEAAARGEEERLERAEIRDVPEVLEVVGARGGLLPLLVEVANAGSVLLPAGTRGADDVGATLLEVSWKKGTHEERMSCPLPCDLSPGQVTAVPFSLRLPGEYGSCELYLSVVAADGRPISEGTEVRILQRP